MKKSTNTQAIEITRRFFKALNLAIEMQMVDGIKGFCDNHKLNRTKYQRLKNDMDTDKPFSEWMYKCIDVDALQYVHVDFGISAEWLLTGKGKMTKRKDDEDSKNG